MNPGATSTGPSASGLRGRLSKARRSTGAVSPHTFAMTYLPRHFVLPPSRMHQELFTLLADMTIARGARIAIAAPRGHAKSTVVSLAYVLWCVCYGKEPYILLFSSTSEQASDFLGHIRTELTSNDLIAQDFPELTEPPGPARWRKEEIITRTGIKITALGAEKKVRGRRNNQHRPSLIILDDIESEQDCRNPEPRRQRLDWLQRSVLKAGSASTNVVVVGTVVHFDGLLATLLDRARSPGWNTRMYRAVEQWSAHPELWEQWEAIFTRRDSLGSQAGPAAAEAFMRANQPAMLEGTRVLWPEREDYAKLMEIRLTEGRFSFDAEKQNQPVNPEDCLFRDQDFMFWDDQFADDQALLRALDGHVRLYGACDPSLGKKGKNHDDTAIITIAHDIRSGIMYVLDALILRRKPDQIIDAVMQMHAMRRYLRFGFEINQFQEFVASELSRRSQQAGLPVPVLKVHHSTDKLGRIQRLQPLICSGALRLNRRHRDLLEQLSQFPMAAHDDGPDALELAVTVVERPREPFAVVVSPGGASRDGVPPGETVHQMYQRLRQDPEWGWA